MTVVLIHGKKDFIGVSGDTKPTDAPGGSTFYETDSGALYVYDGTAWAVKPDGGPFRGTKTITFDGTVNLGQAASNTTLFTVTGEVLVKAIAGFCTTPLTEGAPTATLSLGVTGAVALFIPATDSVQIDADEFWIDTSPDGNGIALPAGLKDILITDDILIAAAVQDTDGGVLRVDCQWTPMSANGLLVPA